MHRHDVFDQREDAPAPEERAMSTWLDDPPPYVALIDDRVLRMRRSPPGLPVLGHHPDDD